MYKSLEDLMAGIYEMAAPDGAYFGLSGHLFRFHPARRFGVIRPA